MNFINKFSYKLKFTEYDLVIKVIMIMIIIIFKKTHLQFISTKKKKAKCSCEEIEKKKQGEIQSFKIRSPWLKTQEK